MGDGEASDRLIAWNLELTAAHDRLRRALQIARNPDAADLDGARRDLMLYCHGFCLALRGHHESEYAGLFPALRARHPELGEAIAKLAHDHELIAALLTDLDQALTAPGTREQVTRQLDGIAAIMESHFQYEERQLLGVLSTLEIGARPQDLLGPL